MSKLLLLTKILLKNGSGTEQRKGKSKSQWWIILLLGVAFAPLIIQLIDFIGIVYDSLVVMGQAGLILSLGLTLTSFVIFFFGIFYVMNTFYFAEDVENLLPLPLTPWQILGAKFITVTVYEYLTEAFILLPLFIVFGIKSGGGFMYYLYAVLIFILLPVIPLVVASILVMIIMRFTNITRNKDRFKLIGGIIAIFLGIGINVAIQRYAMSTQSPEQIQEMLLSGNNSLVRLTSSLFPSSGFAAEGLVRSSEVSGALNFLWFLLITAVFAAVFMFLGQFMYFKGVIGISESASRRKAISKDELTKLSVAQSGKKSYILKELRILFRTPIYFINCVLMNFLWPVFLLIPLFTQSDFMETIKAARGALHNGDASSYILMGAFVFLMFITATNAISATSISREGQELYVNHYLPISYKDQIMAKVLTGVLVGIIGMITLLIAAFVLLQPPIYLAVLILGLGLVAIFFSSFTGMVLDLYNPKLNWDNEQKAVKQNLNVIFNMLISVAFGGLTVLAVLKFNLNLAFTALFLAVVYGLLNALLYRFLSTKGTQLFRNLEV